MTATEELRRMLDERGVEWMGTDYTKPTQGHPTKTSLGEEYNNAEFIEYFDGNVLRLFDITTEQAIEATLGRGTCHPVVSDNLTESEGTGDAWANCSECGHLLCVLTDPSSQMPNYCSNCGRQVVDDASVD